MPDIKTEIDKFFKWAEISPREFAHGKGPSHASQAEWTDDYPYYSDFCKSIPSAIENLNSLWDDEIANLLITAIAIDDEDSFVVENISQNLNNLSKFAKIGHKNINPMVRYAIAEILLNNDQQIQILNRLKKDSNPMVSKRANSK